MKDQEITTRSDEETRSFAARFAKNLNAGDVLAIYGELGAGKTTFIQGLAYGLGYAGRVFSPTFVIARPYKISTQKEANKRRKREINTLYHIDLYRIEKGPDLGTIGIEDFLNDKTAICAVEWPEKIEDLLPKNATRIKIFDLGEGKRKIKVSG
jgi:tRNA threonylcarbamoyladenosine biosynthesis protein TsaE